jgi:Spy/CpxP family protein refolding chaperone
VLTPAQAEKAKEMHAKRKEKKARRGHGKQARGKMMRALDLDENQKASVKEITQSARADIRKIVEEDFGGDRKAAREAVKERRLKMRADIKAELTPEQAARFAEFEERAKEHKGKRGKRERGPNNRGN